MKTDSTDNKCQNCHKRKAQDPHPCPFLSDVHNNSKTKCTCCEECTTNCAMEI